MIMFTKFLNTDRDGQVLGEEQRRGSAAQKKSRDG